MEKTEKKHKRIRFSTIFILLILIVGVGILLYPTVSDWYNRWQQNRMIDRYERAVKSGSTENNQALWDQAKAYNEKLARTGINLDLTTEDDSTPEKQEYLKTLDVSGTGVMGYISIPSVNIHLPIYHDTTDSVLQIAVGHLAGTSLPVGGKNTHSVLTGHTGLPSAKLFTDIDKLKKGDIFQIKVLNHTMTYQVEKIQTVLPSEVSSLQIEPGRDLVTLVTCTPYGINTHRLLVTGHRIPNPKHIKGQNVNRRTELLIGILAAVIVILMILFLIVRKKRKKKMQHTS